MVFFCRLKDYFPALQEEGFTTGQQAIMQLIALGVTLGISMIGGAITGDAKNLIDISAKLIKTYLFRLHYK